MIILDRGVGWLAIDKPSGLPSHATNLKEADALSEVAKILAADSVLARECAWDGFTGCAHRLDRETSGVLLLVTQKNKASLFQNVFAETDRSLRKMYRAVLRGNLVRDEGVWSFPISDSSEGRMNPQGKAQDRKPSETGFKVSRRNDFLTEVAVDLRTGRQHQIRKHAALAKHAVVGDLRYGDKKHASMIANRFGVERLLLHAESLEVSLSGETISLSAPLPSEFKKVFGDEL